ncbi:Pyridine nucleotide-disulfide oxidoreductase [uncultured delta proteobacterium]|uniref:Pyridine nucleotide-disulfide oxidoreductase n=1 Tax=uncultured delta proteobacterium TaxID=34034 RepID=A0A212K6M1_9DELT|nr:Pyridine nucleotide-disulfide oxidoreductase [uncultured delta proteobacterium]
MDSTFDVIIIGAGPGGTTAARLLAQGGKKVALVEDTHLGGTCLNQGCIPTKFLLAATAPIGELHDQERFCALTCSLSMDFAALQKRKDRFVKGTAASLSKTLSGLGVAVHMGRGRITGPGTVAVDGDSPVTLTGKDIILATGSRPASFPGMEPDGEAVLDSTMLLAQSAIPESLLVIGAGAIGMEFSDFFAAAGAKVTVVEGMPQLVPTEDADIAAELRKITEKSGRACITGRKVASLATRDGRAELTFEDGETLVAAKALVAVGRSPNTGGLGVESLGGSLNARGFVQVDETLLAAPGCYAIGDVNGKTLLAHAADHQAEYVARRILGRTDGAYASGPVPSCVFGHAEVMRVGKTAREALAEGRRVEVSVAPMSMNPIAQAHGSSAGFAKAVWADGELAGMAAVGYGASHLVTAAQLLVLGRHTPESLHAFMFCHPTLDEILKSALTAPRTPVSN